MNAYEFFTKYQSNPFMLQLPSLHHTLKFLYAYKATKSLFLRSFSFTLFCNSWELVEHNDLSRSLQTCEQLHFDKQQNFVTCDFLLSVYRRTRSYPVVAYCAWYRRVMVGAKLTYVLILLSQSPVTMPRHLARTNLVRMYLVIWMDVAGRSIIPVAVSRVSNQDRPWYIRATVPYSEYQYQVRTYYYLDRKLCRVMMVVGLRTCYVETYSSCFHVPNNASLRTYVGT